jgi:MFS family permease
VKTSRDETDAERYDRNWGELIQELRVAQTGVQVLAGFLLTLPFSSRFGDISQGHRAIYLVAFSLAVITVGLMTAPVALHRFLFGRQEKDVLVHTGDVFAKLGMAAMGLTLVTVVMLIFAVVVNDTVGIIAGVLVFVFYALVWVALPLSLLRRGTRGQ